MHPFKALLIHISLGFVSETGQYGICHTCLYGMKQTHTEIIVIQFFKETPIFVKRQFLQVVRNMICTEIGRSSNDRLG